jgi:2-keto-4-pentenoate hydratase
MNPKGDKAAVSAADLADMLWSFSSHQSPSTTTVVTTLREYFDANPGDGLRVQLMVLDRLIEDGRSRGGWKVALTSSRARKGKVLTSRPFGYIMQDRIFASGGSLAVAAIPPARMVEPEICLRMGRRVDSPLASAEAARDSVAELIPAFEIGSAPIPLDVPVDAFMAIAMGNWGLVIGKGVPPDVPLDGKSVEFIKDGVTVSSGVISEEVIDNPFESLVRLSASLHDQGVVLNEGDYVLTGSFLPGDPLHGPGRFQAKVDGMGEVAFDFL